MKSGRDVGREHLATLQAFLGTGTALPLGRDGTVNLAELARLTGIPKSSFYQNPSIRSLLGERRPVAKTKPRSNSAEPPADCGLETPNHVSADTTEIHRLRLRNHSLEQQATSHVAEISELRKQIKALQLRLGRQDMMIDTGRRVVAALPGE